MNPKMKALLRNAHDDKTEWNRCRARQTKRKYSKDKKLTKYFASKGDREYTLHLDPSISETLGI